jgi:hypothetical protein
VLRIEELVAEKEFFVELELHQKAVEKLVQVKELLTNLSGGRMVWFSGVNTKIKSYEDINTMDDCDRSDRWSLHLQSDEEQRSKSWSLGAS